MSLQEIIQENKYYQIEKEALELQLENKKDFIKSVNEDLDLNDIKQLSYTEAKSLRKLLYYNLSAEQRIQFDLIISELKEAQYPMLKYAHYYPVINEIDFLPDDKKRELDKLLRDVYNGYVYTSSHLWYKLHLKEETTEKVMEFLYKKGILEKTYAIDCDCDNEDGECSPEILTQKQYDKFIECHSITKEQIAQMTEKQKDEHEKNWYNYGYIEVGCWNDGGKEICNLEDFMRNVRLHYYRNVVKPDKSLDNL